MDAKVFFREIDKICDSKETRETTEADRERSVNIIKQFCSYTNRRDVIFVAARRLITFASTRVVNSSQNEFQDSRLDWACEAIYELCSVKGYKNVVKSFPHDVQDLHAVCATLISLSRSVHLWRTQYSLLLWVAVLMLNPFDMTSVVANKEALIVRLHQICTAAMDDAGPTREAAAFCLSTMLNRQDVPIIYLDRFVCKTAAIVDSLLGSGSSAFVAMGSFKVLATVYKRGDRCLLQEMATRVFEVIRPCFEAQVCVHLQSLKHLAVKLVTRIGVAVLKPRSAPWCYTRGKRALLINKFEIWHDVDVGDDETSDVKEAVGLEDIKFQSLLESVIGVLLEAMVDTDTRIRWSGAKGIGRIASRLPRGLADDIVKSILSLFSDPASRDDDNAWHGSCLALAELSRLGTLLPIRLPEALSAVTAAMTYELRRGAHYIGAHVRDAACYVAWAFARAYAPQTLSPYLPSLVEEVVLVAVFDREVHVRRAAGAALQENIGRQGVQMFGAVGINLTQALNFCVLGSRERAYVEVAPTVAKMGYWEPLLNKLLHERVKHWDSSIRLLTAKSLYALVTDILDKATTHDVTRRIISMLAPLASKSRDLPSRHGSLLALAYVTYAIGAVNSDVLSAELSAVVPRLEAARFYRGRDGTLVRVAACSLIAALASRGCQLTLKAQLRLLDSLDRSASHAMEAVRAAAAAGARMLTMSYFGAGNCTQPAERLLSRTVFRYVALVREAATANVSRGACNLLGALPARLLVADKSTLDSILDTLLARSCRNDVVAGEKDAETRRDALVALKNIVFTINLSHLKQSVAWKLHSAFVHDASYDFGADQRGDVGSWSRIQGLEAAVGLCAVLNSQSNCSRAQVEAQIVPGLCQRARNWSMHKFGSDRFVTDSSLLTIHAAMRWSGVESEELCCALIRHLGEQLDAVRRASLWLLPIFFQHAPVVPKRYEIEKLLFTNAESIEIPARLCACLSLGGAYHDAVLGGVLQSAGCGESKTSSHFRGALVQHAVALSRCADSVGMTHLTRALALKTQVLSHAAVPLSTEERKRSHLPLLRCLAVLIDAGTMQWIFNKGITNSAAADDFAYQLISGLSALIACPRLANHVSKTCAAADALLAALFAAASTPSIGKLSLSSLLQGLFSPYPRIRAYIAEQLYARLTELSFVQECFLDTVQLSTAQELLGSVPWSNRMCTAQLEIAVSPLAHILTIDSSCMKWQPVEMGDTSDELESYTCLLKEAGY